MKETGHAVGSRESGFPFFHLAVVIVAAAFYQLFIFFAYPLTSGPDGWTFFTHAEQLVSGESYSPFVIRLRTPVYPLFLAFLIWATGESGGAIVAVHHLLGLLFVAVFFCSMVRYGRGFATVVGLLVAVAPQVMDHFHFCSSEPLYLLCLGTAVLSIQQYFDRRSARWAIASGASIQLANLVRPVLGPVSYVLILWLALKRAKWWVRVLVVVSWLAPWLAASAYNKAHLGFFAPQAGGGYAAARGVILQHKVSEPDDGPYIKQFYADLARDYEEGLTDIRWHPGIWEEMADRDDLLVEAIRLQTLRHGYDEASIRMNKIAREAMFRHPVKLGVRVSFQMAKFLRFPSRLMVSYFAEARPMYKEPQHEPQRKTPDYESWVYTRDWPGMDDQTRRTLTDRIHHYNFELWAARPVGSPMLLTLLQEWENMILLPGFWLAAFGLAAIVLRWRTEDRDVLLLYAILVLGHAFVCSLVLYVSNRYVSVILPWYIALAAVGVRDSLHWWAARQRMMDEG